MYFYELEVIFIFSLESWGKKRKNFYCIILGGLGGKKEEKKYINVVRCGITSFRIRFFLLLMLKKKDLEELKWVW